MSKLNLDEFEKIIAYKSLTDSGYLATIIDFIKPNYFKHKSINNVFTIIKDFYIKRNKPPTVTEIKSYLNADDDKQEFKLLVESFRDIDNNLDTDELYDNTEQFIKEKAVYYTMLDVAENLSKEQIDTSKILHKFETACNISLVTDTGLDLFGDVDQLIDDLNKVEKYIPSRWEWLDKLLGGGFIENGRSLYVFAGETNIGKSIFLGNVASNIALQNKNVLLITLEMSELLYAKRLCTNVTKIPLHELKNNTQHLKSLMSKQQGNIFIKEFPPSTITPNQVKAFIKKFTDQHIKIDAVVIDYLNLIHSTIGINSYERVKYVTEQIRALSYVFECPFISATQITRGGFGTTNPGLETISESIGLAQTADVIISIFQNDEDKELGVIRLGAMKNRYGMRGVTQVMNIDYSTLTITQSDEVEMDADDISLNMLELLDSK